MSLDVYLTIPGVAPEAKRQAIYIRENGSTKEITRQEWDERFPGIEPVIFETGVESRDDTVYTANITHNLGLMAHDAGLYAALWHPGENGFEKACDLIPELFDGLARLKSDPERYKAFNPTNGWGTYEGLVEFVTNYLAACGKWPHADVSVWI